MGDETRIWRAAAILSAAAALVHVVAVDEHLREWWGYGLFFLFASIAQMFYTALLLLRPWRKTPPGERDAARERGWLWAGIAGNGFLVVFYVLTRTVGVPFFGPAAGEVEEVTGLGVASKLFESALIVLLAMLLRSHRARDA